MDITPLIPKTSQVIQSYGSEGFKVSGIHYPSSIVILQDRTIAWSAHSLDNLTINHFNFMENQEMPEVFLLGTGKQMRFIPADLKHQLSKKGIFIEPMDSGAACRTYNTLLADGRSVCACILVADL